VNSFGTQHDTVTQLRGLDSTGDEVLVAAARSGDSSAFVELSRRHSRRVLLKIYRITNNWQDAEDVLQESLMRAFIHLDTFERRASFSTWLTRIAINTALMLLRKEKGGRRFAIERPLDDSAAQSENWELRDHRDNPEQHFAQQQRANMLKGAMLRLRPESRRVIELQQKDELSTKEIAQSLGISESAVKSRVLRAKIALKEFVQKRTPRCRICSQSHSALRCGMN
jgi:RNA polymerase sigma-70 factor, ECF subfamily